MQTFPTQRWQSAARPLHTTLCSHSQAKPPPARVPQLRRAPAPTSPPTALLLSPRERMSQVSSSSREKAACHVPGGEGQGQDPEQAWGGRRHQVWALKWLIHLMSPGTVDLAGNLPHPLSSKQPLSCTQGTAGVLGAGSSRGQCVAPCHRNTPEHEAAPSQALQGVLGAAG